MAKTCERTKLTKRAVDAALPQSDGKQRLYFDTELRGFGLCVGAKTKTYFAQGTVRGRFQRIAIGRHGVFTAEQARRKAQQVLAKIARGQSPVEERRKAAIRGFTLRQALELSEQSLKNKGAVTRQSRGTSTAPHVPQGLAGPAAQRNFTGRHTAPAYEDRGRRCGGALCERPSSAKKADRVPGWQVMRRLLQDARKPDVPGLYIARHWEYFWATVPYLGRDPKCIEDVDSRGPDHAADATRYGCLRQSMEIQRVRLSGV